MFFRANAKIIESHYRANTFMLTLCDENQEGDEVMVKVYLNKDTPQDIRRKYFAFFKKGNTVSATFEMTRSGIIYMPKFHEVVRWAAKKDQS